MNYIKFCILALLVTNNLILSDSTKMWQCYAEPETTIEGCIETHCGGKTSVEKFNDCIKKGESCSKCYERCETNCEKCKKENQSNSDSCDQKAEGCSVACYNKCPPGTVIGLNACASNACQ